MALRATRRDFFWLLLVGNFTACGPSAIDSLPGTAATLNLADAATLTVDEGGHPPTQDANTTACGTRQEFKFVRDTQQVSLRRCNEQGIAELEAFRLSEPKEMLLADNLQRVRMKRFEKTMQLCLRPQAGLSRLVFENHGGTKEIFMAIDAVAEDTNCAKLTDVNGVFERAALEKMLVALPTR